MKRRSLANIAFAAASAIAALGFALTGGSLKANPPDSSFGPVTFHQAPTERRIVVDPQQVREHPGELFSVWTGYSTYPEFTPAQRDMIRAAKGGAKGGGGGHGGGGSGGGGGGGGTTTIPYWEHSITSPLDGQTYTMSMVGSDPYASTPAATTVTYVPIILRVTINGVVYDPTQPACNDSVSVANRFFGSPLFADASNWHIRKPARSSSTSRSRAGITT